MFAKTVRVDLPVPIQEERIKLRYGERGLKKRKNVSLIQGCNVFAWSPMYFGVRNSSGVGGLSRKFNRQPCVRSWVFISVVMSLFFANHSSAFFTLSNPSCLNSGLFIADLSPARIS